MKTEGIANNIYLLNVFTSKSKFEINGNGNEIIIGYNSKIGNTKIFILGNNNSIQIGENCRFKNLDLWIEDNNCIIKIADGTTIESAHIAATENNSIITIGADCMLAKEIVIRSGDSHSIIDIETNKRINHAQNIHIGNHVWIGERAIILKGVSIGDNSVIGTGSVLTSSCEKNSIMAGVPAKKIKSNITWKRERIL